MRLIFLAYSNLVVRPQRTQEPKEAMTRTLKPILAATLAFAVLFSQDAAFGQDSTDAPTASSTLKPADQVLEDVLNLNDPMLSIWPDVNTLEIEALSAIVPNLTEAYEADRLDADERTREIDAMISESERIERVIKDESSLAKEAEDDVEKERLKDLKDLYVLRRKYLVRIKNLRAEERKLAETRIDYVRQLDEVLQKSDQLLSAREEGGGKDLPAIERELIRQSKELGARLSAVAGNLKKVNSERDKAFSQREKLMSANN